MSLPDLEEFRPYMDGFNITDKEKDEVTMALWKIAQHFVDQAFGREPSMQPLVFLEAYKKSEKKVKKRKRPKQS